MSTMKMSPEGRASNGRLRRASFPERKQRLLRLPKALYQRLVDASETAAFTNTAYIIVALEMAMAGDTDEETLSTFGVDFSDGKVTLTLRLLPSLARRVEARAKVLGVPVNRLIAFAIQSSIGRTNSRRR